MRYIYRQIPDQCPGSSPKRGKNSKQIVLRLMYKTQITQESTPWKKLKDEDSRGRTNTVMHSYIYNICSRIEQLLIWNCQSHPRRCRDWRKTSTEARDLWSSYEHCEWQERALWSKGSGVLAGKKLNMIWEAGCKKSTLLRVDKKQVERNQNKYKQ